MKTYIKLAWRNIWRNKRRTLITAASIFFAVFFALIMRSFQVGSYDHMTHNVVEAYTGYIQIHGKGYEEEKTLDYSFEQNDSLINALKTIDNIKTIVPRFETGALAAMEEQSKVVFVAGVDVAVEDQLTKLSEKIVAGQYLKADDNGVLISERLAKYLGIAVDDTSYQQTDTIITVKIVKDTLVLIGQGFQGTNAEGLFPVRGIVYFPSPELDRRMVYMTIPTAQATFSADNRLTTLALNLKNENEIDATIEAISQKIDMETYEILSWQEILSELVQQIESDEFGGLVMLGLLYLIIAFGVLGTVLMMTAERKREFGVMVAIGMQKSKLTWIVAIELIIIALLGILGGVLGSIPFVYYYTRHPIRYTGEMAKVIEEFGIEPVMPFAFDMSIYINQALIILIIVAFVILYPLARIGSLNVSKSLRA